VDDTITHVVAARDGTDKIRLARRVPGCHVVKPSWLMECVWTMTRRDVTPHLLGKPAVAVAKEPQAMAATGDDSSSSSDDDDNLAAMLEADMME
jgi:RNA polymerase II subunit A-like phosphatase